MRFGRTFVSLLTAAVLTNAYTGHSAGQQPTAQAPAEAASPTQTTTAPAATQSVTAKAPAAGTKTPPLTEDALRARLLGKTVFLRGFYTGDSLTFDETGKVNGSPATTSFTLSALEIKKVQLSKHKLEIEADRYGLHYLGSLPYDDGSKPYDKVKISKKPIHITIERELVVVPKIKKEKEKAKPVAPSANSAKTQPSTGATNVATAGAASAPPAASPGTSSAPADPAALQPGTTTSPEHSAMLMNKAIDDVFATDVDGQMISRLPAYWKAYFLSRSEHREFVPADKSAHALVAGITPPQVLNSIDPSSNEYAQKYGITGLALCRTVVDASGKPEEIAIARPIGFGLDEKAVEAIMKSRFTPATQGGQPVPVVLDVVVTFRIYSNRTKPGSVIKGAKSSEVAGAAWDGGTTKAAKN